VIERKDVRVKVDRARSHWKISPTLQRVKYALFILTNEVNNSKIKDKELHPVTKAN